jgi:hypothetical protein
MAHGVISNKIELFIIPAVRTSNTLHFSLSNSLYSHRRYPYFDVVVGLAWSYDPESYAGGSVAAGRVSHAGQVKGDYPDRKGYPDFPGWRLGVRLTAPSRKKL